MLDVRFAGGGELVAGDLLRLSAGGWSVLAPAGPAPADAVDARGDPLPPPAPGAVRLALDLTRAVASRPVTAGAPATVDAAVRLRWTGRDGAWGASGDGHVRRPDARGRLRVELDAPAADAPAPGTLVAVAGAGADELWLEVEELSATERGAGRARRAGVVDGGAAETAGARGGRARRAARAGAVGRAAGCGAGAAGRARVRTRAPALGREPALRRASATRRRSATARRRRPPPLWGEAARFPLAGAGAPADGLLVPLALGVAPERFLGAHASAAPPLRRDGIVLAAGAAGEPPQLDAALFLDHDLADVGARALADAADAIRFRAARPRALRGLHAARSIDEATLLAVPDAVQRPWREEDAPPLPPVTADPRRRPTPTRPTSTSAERAP